MDQEAEAFTQGQSTKPVTNEVIVKLELPWSIEEEPQDQPSAVYSTVYPMSDNTSGSLLSLNTSHACQRCSAVFKLFSSLRVHLETFHGEGHSASELPVASSLQDSASEITDEMSSRQERLSTQTADDSRQDSEASSIDFVIKLEPPWSIKEEPQDHPSAVCSTAVQPRPHNASGSLLSQNTSHVCQLCSTTFVLFSSLELHSLAFHGQALHDVFPRYSAYNRDSVRYHGGSKTVGNSNKKAVKGRRERADNKNTDRTGQGKNPRKHVCDVCSKAFTKVSHLKAHKMIHAGQKPFVCDVCDKAFTQSSSLKQHKMLHTGQKPFVCDVCNMGFAYAGRLKSHKMIHMGVKPFACDVCSKTFPKPFNLKAHKLLHAGVKPFVCDVCDKGFTLAGSLKTHKLIHTGSKSFVCDVCNEAFSKAGNLKRHKFIHLSHVCDVCNRTFAQSCHLKEHKRIHTGEKPFVCDICSKAFSRVGDLNMHKMIHTGHKSFVCDICSKAFHRASNLKTHKVVHTTERPFVCEFCSKAFSRAQDLKMHKLIHTGDKPFACGVCSEAFTHPSALKRHRTLHTEERTYKCSHCDDVPSTDSDSLQEHIRSVHASLV